MADRLRMPGTKNKMKSFTPTKESIRREPVWERDFKNGGVKETNRKAKPNNTQRLLSAEFNNYKQKSEQYKKTKK